VGIPGRPEILEQLVVHAILQQALEGALGFDRAFMKILEGILDLLPQVG